MAAATDPLALADFEAGLDGLAENDLVDEAEVDTIVREAILHAIGDTPWADAKAGAGQAGTANLGAPVPSSRSCPPLTSPTTRRWVPGRPTSSRPS